MVSIRPADKSDLSNLVALDKKAHAEKRWWSAQGRRYFIKLMRRRGLLFVAEEHGSLVGYVSGDVQAVKGKRRVSLENLFVERGYRKKKIAKRLVNSFISAWTGKGIKEMILFCPPQLEGFYNRFGFKLTVIRMKRRLTA